MGSGASMEKDSLKPLLLSEELVNGSASLASNALLRTSFTNYLKGGAWLDRLSQLVPDVQSGFSENSHEDNDCMLCLKEYNVDQARLDAFNSSSSGKLEKGRSVTLSTFGSFSKPLPIIARRYGDLYSGDTKSFTHQELLVILFALLYPIYLSSREYERFVKYGVEHDSSPRDETSVRSAVPGGNRHASRMVQTNQSKRAQELTLSCAARYDESLLLDCLQEATWLERLCPIFNGHTLALCITDTAKPGLPILFVNKAFCCMFGYTQSELIGHDLSVLNGPSTEPPQLELMHSNIHSTAIVKFAITLQHKSKKPLLDLVAQKAVGTYSISAHFVMTKSTSLDVLNMVDDALILLSYLVKAPVVPAPRPSWLPAPIAVLAKSATSAISHSPSSARSRASGDGLFNRNGKSTPSSVRSFRSIVSGGTMDRGRASSNGSFRSHRSVRHATVRQSSGVSVGDKGLSRDASGASMRSAGKHVPVDEDGAAEYCVGESTADNSAVAYS